MYKGLEIIAILYSYKVIGTYQTYCLLLLIPVKSNNDISHEVASGCDKTPCNKINEPLVLYRFSNVT